MPRKRLYFADEFDAVQQRVVRAAMKYGESRFGIETDECEQVAAIIVAGLKDYPVRSTDNRAGILFQAAKRGLRGIARAAQTQKRDADCVSIDQAPRVGGVTENPAFWVDAHAPSRVSAEQAIREITRDLEVFPDGQRMIAYIKDHLANYDIGDHSEEVVTFRAAELRVTRSNAAKCVIPKATIRKAHGLTIREGERVEKIAAATLTRLGYTA